MEGISNIEYDLLELKDDGLVNFVYTMDAVATEIDSTTETPTTIQEIEDGVIKILVQTDVDQLNVFYPHHTDLFIRYQFLFVNKMKDRGFEIMNYMKWRNAYANVEMYFNGLKMHYKISKHTSTNVKGMSPSKVIGLFQRYTKGSIFSIVEPDKFARICHRLFVYYYVMTETRYIHYVSMHNTVLYGYAAEMMNLFNNFVRKMEFEVELFCLMGNVNGLVDAFTKMATTFLNLGDVPFGKVCIMLMERFKVLKEKKIREYQQSLQEIKFYNKYNYFVSPEVILRAFIQSNELNNKVRLFVTIYQKVYQTKKQLLDIEEITTQADVNDFVVFNYLQPMDAIKKQLYTGRGEIECLKRKQYV